MPWIARPSHAWSWRLRHSFGRWRYDHSEALVSTGIGAAVIVAALVVIAVMRVAG